MIVHRRLEGKVARPGKRGIGGLRVAEVSGVGGPLGPAAVGVDFALKPLVAHIVGACAMERRIRGRIRVIIHVIRSKVLDQLLVVVFCHVVVCKGADQVAPSALGPAHGVFEILEDASLCKKTADAHGIHGGVLVVFMRKSDGTEKAGANAAVDENTGAGFAPAVEPARAGAAVVAHKGDIARDHDVVRFLFLCGRSEMLG